MVAVERRFGQNADGTLSLCRAKPENVGKGRCKHGQHIMSDASDATIRAFNEEVLAKAHGALATSTNKARQEGEQNTEVALKKATPTPGMVSSYYGRSMTRKEFHESVESVAEQFSHEDYSFIRDFYSKFEDRLNDPRLQRRFQRAEGNIYAFLSSKDPIARRTREFLGDDVDLKEFSRIIATNVKSMTASIEWRNDGRRHQPQRIILTSAMNDMTRERYVASVMFFGGRCCYCHKPFQSGVGNEHAASGEHLTPVTPKNPPPGTTRYGNMALACIGCNKERRNKDLNEWVQSTSRIPEDKKDEVLSRIESFRRFALYKEMTPEQVKKVSKSIDYINRFMKQFEVGEDGRYDRRSSGRIRGVYNSQIMKLRESLR
jgi:hypothetical protein